MKVKDVMHSGATWLGPDASLAEAAREMRDGDIGAVPVGENDRLIGMVTDRDIVCRAVANGSDLGKVTVRDVMTNGIVYCKADEDVEHAVQIMEEKKIRRLPVIDANKRMVGMLGLGDVSHRADSGLSNQLLHAVAEPHL